MIDILASEKKDNEAVKNNNILSTKQQVMKPRQKFGIVNKRHTLLKNKNEKKRDDDTSSKAASRILNISGTKMGSFAFPKRERFNEEVEQEI